VTLNDLEPPSDRHYVLFYTIRQFSHVNCVKFTEARHVLSATDM